MTNFLFQLLNVHRWLRVSMVLASVWALSATSAHASWFECNTFSLSFTAYSAPNSMPKSDGNGGLIFVTRQIENAGETLYAGNLVATARCNTSDAGTWRYGGLVLNFGNVAQTFAGGGLTLIPNGRPTYTNSNPGNCGTNNVGDPRTAGPGPFYGTLWDNDEFAMGIGCNHWSGSIFTITAPVLVKGTGTTVTSGTPLIIPFKGHSADFGWIDGPTAKLSGAPTGCVVSPSTSTIALPSIPQLQLTMAGATSAAVLFTINLSGCGALSSGAYLANATWSYTPGVGPSTMANTATSPAGNVEFQLLDSNNNPVANNAVTNIATGITGGTHSKNFAVRYYATGKATPGNVRGVATFNITYQ